MSISSGGHSKMSRTAGTPDSVARAAAPLYPAGLGDLHAHVGQAQITLHSSEATSRHVGMCDSSSSRIMPPLSITLCICAAVCRNVTVTGRPGSLPELDLSFKHEVLALCPSCSMTLRSLALTRARRGAGDGVQAIVGSEQRGAVLLLQDVVRHRIACSPAEEAAAVISETPRGAVAWRSTMGSQQLRVGSAEYKVRCATADACNS